MGCDCIQKIEDKIRLENYAASATLGSSSSQRSEVSYRPITAEGRPSKHNRYTPVRWVYCPFCGLKI